MPQYQIQDTQTGRVVTVEGDTPPTQDDADSIFQQAGLQGNTQSTPSSPQVSQSATTKPSLGGFLSNLLPSAVNTGEGVASGLLNILNPDLNHNTLVNLARIPVGAGEKLANAVAGSQFNDGNTQRVDALVNMVKNRYGSPNAIGNTLYTDPFGAALDASSVLDGGASLIGKAADIGKLGALGDTAEAVGGVSRAINPVTQGANLAGKTIEALGNSPLGQLVQAPFKGAYNPQIDALGAQYGINLPASAVSSSRLVKGGEALAERGNMFGHAVTDNLAQAHNQLNDLSSSVSNEVAQDPSLYETGQALKEGLQGNLANFHDQTGSIYDAVTQGAGHVPASLTNTNSILDTILDENKNNVLDNGNNVFTKLKSIVGPMSDLKGKINPEDQLTFNNLKATRTGINNMIDDTANPISSADRRNLLRLKDALTQDMQDTLTSHDPELAAAFSQNNQDYAQGINQFNSDEGKKINSYDPEKLVGSLIKPNSQTSIEKVKELVGPDAFTNVQQSFMSQLYKNAMGKDGTIDPGKLQTQLNKYGNPTLSRILTPEQLDSITSVQKKLNDINTLKSSLRNPAAQGSQTAFLAGQGALGGLLVTHPLLAGKLLATQFASGKLFSSPLGKKLLTSGVDVAGPTSATLKSVGNKGAKVAIFGNAGNRANQAGNDALLKLLNP